MGEDGWWWEEGGGGGRRFMGFDTRMGWGIMDTPDDINLERI